VLDHVCARALRRRQPYRVEDAPRTPIPLVPMGPVMNSVWVCSIKHYHVPPKVLRNAHNSALGFGSHDPDFQSYPARWCETSTSQMQGSPVLTSTVTDEAGLQVRHRLEITLDTANKLQYELPSPGAPLIVFKGI